MDRGKLKELKSKYQDLLDKIPEIVENELNDNKTWKHRILLNILMMKKLHHILF